MLNRRNTSYTMNYLARVRRPFVECVSNIPCNLPLSSCCQDNFQFGQRPHRVSQIVYNFTNFRTLAVIGWEISAQLEGNAQIFEIGQPFFDFYILSKSSLSVTLVRVTQNAGCRTFFLTLFDRFAQGIFFLFFSTRASKIIKVKTVV